METVAADGLRFDGAVRRLKEAGFGLREEPAVADSGLRVSLAHESGFGLITLVDSVEKPHIIMNIVLQDWYDLVNDFRRGLATALPTPPTVEDDKGLLILNARIAGRDVMISLIPANKGGIRQLAFTAVAFPEATPQTADGPPPFDRPATKPEGLEAAPAKALIAWFARTVLEAGPRFEKAGELLAEAGFRETSDGFFLLYAEGEAEVEASPARAGAKNAPFILRMDLKETLPVVEALREAFAAEGVRLEGEGLKAWGEPIVFEGRFRGMLLALPAEESDERSISVAAICFL